MHSTKRKVVDLSQAPDPLTDEFITLPGEELMRWERYFEHAERATLADSGVTVISEMVCGLITNGKYCGGQIELKRLDLPPEIHWECKRCGDKGKIINFANTPWDLRQLTDEEKQNYLDEINQDPADFDDEPFDEWYDDYYGSSPQAREEFELFNQWLDQQSPEEIENLLETATQKYGIMDPDMLMTLLTADWEQPNAPIYISDEIPAEELSDSEFFQNAHKFLLLMQEEGGFKSTQTGNLKRKTVSLMMDELSWPELYLQEVREMNKVINEEDVWRLHTLRKLLEVANLVRLRKNKFELVKKNANLIEDGNEGLLYQHLFTTYFRKMNLGYSSGREEWPALQEAVPYSIYQLGRIERDWYTKEEMFDLLLLFSAKNELLDAHDQFRYLDPLFELETNLLRPLTLFGLLEERYSNGKSEQLYDSPDYYKPTALVDKLITINIES